jgi:hypothetical protein
VTVTPAALRLHAVALNPLPLAGTLLRGAWQPPSLSAAGKVASSPALGSAVPADYTFLQTAAQPCTVTVLGV